LIEFPGLAVHVEIGAREIGRQHRGAEPGRSREQFVDIAILRSADGLRIEPGHRQEAFRVVAAAMRRVEDKRDALDRAFEHEKWRGI
jgi:mannose/cellobiose epimerase-like protein (N-acyl-D-glucosamine 2-epimerase family)